MVLERSTATIFLLARFRIVVYGVRCNRLTVIVCDETRAASPGARPARGETVPRTNLPTTDSQRVALRSGTRLSSVPGTNDPGTEHRFAKPIRVRRLARGRANRSRNRRDRRRYRVPNERSSTSACNRSLLVYPLRVSAERLSLGPPSRAYVYTEARTRERENEKESVRERESERDIRRFRCRERREADPCVRCETHGA